MLQIKIVILALALIISAEEGKRIEDANSQTKREDSTLEHDIDGNDKLSLETEEDLKQKQQGKNEIAENILKNLEKVSELEGLQDNARTAKEETGYGGQQLQDEENRIGQYTGIEKHLNVDINQTQDEENRRGQQIRKEKYLNDDMNKTQGEVEASELKYDVKEMDKNGNDRELIEQKYTNRDEASLEQAQKPSPMEEQYSDPQTAHNNGLEFRQHDQHLQHPLEGYRVTETGQDEAHQLVNQNDFKYLFSYHGGHNLRHGSNIFEGTSLNKHHDVQALTLTGEGSFQQHFPVYIPDEKHVPHSADKTVSFPTKQFVFHPAAVPYTAHKPVPYPVKFPVDRPYFVPVPVEKKVPFAVHVKVPVPQPYTVLLEKKVPAPYPVRIEVPVSQPYPVKVNVPVPVLVPDKVSVDRPVPLPVEEPYYVTVQKEAVEKVPYPLQVRTV
jgi:hypothetical protein